MDAKECISAISQTASQHLNLVVKPETAVWINGPSLGHSVADSTLVFSISGARSSGDFVVLLSNDDFPDAVKEAVGNARGIAGELPPDLAMHVLTPLCADEWDGKSFAVYRRLYSFSENRLIAKLQKQTYGDRIYSWLARVARETSQVVAGEDQKKMRYLDPLEYLVQEPKLSGEIAGAAASIRSAVEADEWTPVTVVEHGDFWLGNVLLPKYWLFDSRRDRFAIIDWGGAKRTGYPFIDLIRYFRATSNNLAVLERRLTQYCGVSNLPYAHVSRYVYSALGAIGMNRNQFPLDRYISLVEDCTGALNSLCADPADR